MCTMVKSLCNKDLFSMKSSKQFLYSFHLYNQWPGAQIHLEMTWDDIGCAILEMEANAEVAQSWNTSDLNTDAEM